MGSPRPTRTRYLVLAWLSVAALLAYMDRACLCVIVGRVNNDLGLSNELMGWVLGAFNLSYALLQIPSGGLGNRWGSRLALPVMCALWSVSLGATAWAGGFIALYASRLVMGAAQAGLFPC